MKLNELIDYLEEVFEYKDFDEPYSSNGLQVEGKENIRKIAFSVDATIETIQRTIDLNCDVLICHHGIFWPSIKHIRGAMREKVKLLLDNDISLIGMHLPLDKHKEIGNNVELIKLLSGKVIEEIDSICYLGEFDKEKNVCDVAKLLDLKLKTKSKVFDFSKKVKTFGVCSGGGSSHFYSFIEKDCDLFITGELRYEVINCAKESGISLISSGHYATETLGIRALMKKMSCELPIEVEFINAKIDF
jgi:dinuclear metal center YbgI/SA1388 family protein